MAINRCFRTWLKAITAVCVVLGTWSCIHAQEGLFDVADLDRLSQIIVVGTISAGPKGQLSLSVDSVLKGSSSIGQAISVDWAPSLEPGCDASAPATPVHGIWFLQKAADGNIEFARFMNSQRCHPSHPNYETPAGPLNDQLSYKSSDSVKYKLAVELASALLDSTTAPVAIQLYPGIFDGLTSTKAVDIYQLLATSSNDDTRMIGDLSLIRSGTTAGLSLLASNSEQIMQTPLANAAMNAGNSAATYKYLLAKAVSSVHVPSAHAVSVLAQIATDTSRDIDLRRAASRSLRNIHSAQAVVALEPLMNDPDQVISMYAISALSCYANAVPVLDDSIPGHNINLNEQGPYKTASTLAHFVIGPMGNNAAADKAYWQQWWLSHQTSIQQAAGVATTD